jgi:protein involved in polysaccharide export with SLBB domain
MMHSKTLDFRRTPALRSGIRKSVSLLTFFILTALAISCTSRDPMRVTGPEFRGDDAGRMAASGPSQTDLAEDADLEQIWQKRSSELSSTKDYPIGPGDVLTVSVSQMDELQDRKVRVTPLGMVELPLVGSVQAGGLTEQQLEAELDRKLNNFMYNPQASVYVNEYHNREVAVIGAVNHPGLVLLDSPSETILDVLTQAGGLSSTAADEIILIPVEQGDPSMARRVSQVAYNPNRPGVGGTAGEAIAIDASAGGGAGADQSSATGVGPGGQLSPHRPGLGIQGGNPAINRRAQRIKQDEAAGPQPDISAHALSMVPSNAHPLSIKIKSTSLTGAGKYINMPMRPGDVIVVPGGGNVMVVGWVQTPGYFQVGSGLTVLGAIGAAGGPMYAADTKDITLIRSNKDGSKDTIPINLDEVSKGEAPDLAVKANDVIDVPYSGLRIGPYIFYSVLSRMGIGGPAIPY